MREYYEVCCWNCGRQIGWKKDYTYPMPSIYCDRCKEKEEEEQQGEDV